MKMSSEAQLRAIDSRLREIGEKIAELKDERDTLLAQKESLKDQCMLEKNKKRAKENWSASDFPWTARMKEILRERFKIPELRPLQLEAINATMANQDVILIMPTGGGKSLCYQLPALLSKGITLVVSPLISLIQDQVHHLRLLGIEALMLSASSSKQDTQKAADALQKSDSNVHLLFVTPERLAKSKRFMNQLQKCAAMGRFCRLAIDEVHCCSTWGHDFRPDYNYLGVLKDMFPKTPILGLTATSSSKVTVDVQKMLNIEGALILRAPFNRPNLFYSVLRKPDSLNDCADLLSEWMKTRFLNQTGIIYTTTIKDCESLATELKNRNIKVGVYHAVLEENVRNRMYERWISGSIQVIVATIAFGLGIDKPDVRFVIHHALSKSMENFYQESGRAGRDGNFADCILLYKLSDVFKLSTMVFTQKTGLENLYGIVDYCLDSKRCRRSVIAEYFDEDWDRTHCAKKCDHCSSDAKYRESDISDHCRALYKLLQHASEQDRQLTAIKLIDAWLNQGEQKLRVAGVKSPANLDRNNCEAVVAYLLIQGYLKEDFHYTAYSTISYLKKGPKAGNIENQKILVQIPKLKNDLGENRNKSETSSSATIASKKRPPEVIEIADDCDVGKPKSKREKK